MKRVLWIVPLFLVLCFSCDDGRESATTPETGGTVGADDVHLTINDVDRTMTVTDADNRQLVIRYDPASQVQHFDCGDFHIEKSQGWFREYTNRDFLEVGIEDLGNGRRLERYNFNDRVLELEIDQWPTEVHREQFMEFYEFDPAINTLQDNPDGAVMAELLERSRPLMLQACRERDPEGFGAYSGALDKDSDLSVFFARPGWANRVCTAADLCVVVKCLFGGASNIGCVTCAAVKVACLFMDIFGWW
jgi:hypothetical protein